MTRKALARRISRALFNKPATPRGAGAAPTRRAARILAGCFVARRSKTTAGILPPTASPARTAAHQAKIRSSAATRASDDDEIEADRTFQGRRTLNFTSLARPVQVVIPPGIGKPISTTGE